MTNAERYKEGWLAEAADVGALAVLLTLTFGCRASEIADRVVRDLDDGGRVLSIPHGKTATARRRLAVPEVLQPLLARAVLHRGAAEPLLPREGLPPTRGWLAYHVGQICREARGGRIDGARRHLAAVLGLRPVPRCGGPLTMTTTPEAGRVVVRVRRDRRPCVGPRRAHHRPRRARAPCLSGGAAVEPLPARLLARRVTMTATVAGGAVRQ